MSIRASLTSVISVACLMASVHSAYTGPVVNRGDKQVIEEITADGRDEATKTQGVVRLRSVSGGWMSLRSDAKRKQEMQGMEVWLDKPLCPIMAKGANAMFCPFHGGCFRLAQGEICVTESLKPHPDSISILYPKSIQWNGRWEGSSHELIGKINILGYEFDSDEKSPLVFKVTDEGYLYIRGSGSVKDLKTGEVHVFK